MAADLPAGWQTPAAGGRKPVATPPSSSLGKRQRYASSTAATPDAMLTPGHMTPTAETAHTPGGATTTRPSRGASTARSRGLGSSNLGSRRRQHLTSTGGKTVSFPRRVAVVLGIAGDIDRTPHELPRSCDVCGDYILGKSFYCDVCTTTIAGATTPTEGRETDADDGDSFDVCSECFAGWQKQPKWPHPHGQPHFLPSGGEDGNGDDAVGDG